MAYRSTKRGEFHVIAMQGGWQNPNTLPLVYGAEGRQARGLSVIREFNAARKRAR